MKYNFSFTIRKKIDILFTCFLVLLISFTILWGFGAFISWNYNIAEWHWLLRSILAIPFIFIILFTILFAIFFWRKMNR